MALIRIFICFVRHVIHHRRLGKINQSLILLHIVNTRDTNVRVRVRLCMDTVALDGRYAVFLVLGSVKSNC